MTSPESVTPSALPSNELAEKRPHAVPPGASLRPRQCGVHSQSSLAAQANRWCFVKQPSEQLVTHEVWPYPHPGVHEVEHELPPAHETLTGTALRLCSAQPSAALSAIDRRRSTSLLELPPCRAAGPRSRGVEAQPPMTIAEAMIQGFMGLVAPRLRAGVCIRRIQGRRPAGVCGEVSSSCPRAGGAGSGSRPQRRAAPAIAASRGTSAGGAPASTTCRAGRRTRDAHRHCQGRAVVLQRGRGPGGGVAAGEAVNPRFGYGGKERDMRGNSSAGFGAECFCHSCGHEERERVNRDGFGWCTRVEQYGVDADGALDRRGCVGA